ncbi:amino acid permease [Vibrio europaeus]|uniref:Tyrosine transporter n=1 Tax=Vibrio europaeus TaxID=300876 RepID=A0A178JER5_9VIBR|nr:aromatic amino acid transport family protein [Vibrio europaeus]MDC5707195.1 tyrosine transporter [Vibrio europaeus]MDC5712560.1 tyrosine transporter [Vibrio europaeus]MDC5717203.1 tyrosine transporter [Vibrio europaeus]MDC5726503.1 tyrosine transporter [Vibrio europaeus]MDC5731413.1 tyrosine transporter [Vibrio europaeus]
MNTKLLGSALIISGTALGAGMLAIPMVLAQFGLLYGTLLMVLIWFGTTYSALLLLEATIKSGGGLGLNSIARKTLGKGGQLVSNGLLYALLICLLMAYILGAADLLSQGLSALGLSISFTQSQIIFTLIAGAIVACGTGVIDKLNRALFFVMIASLAVTLLVLLPEFSTQNLAQVSNNDHVALIQTSAVLFTSFGFMVVIPSLVTYNNEATDKQLRNMVILGSLIPLFCYLCWLFAVVGNLPPEQLKEFASVSELMAGFEHDAPWIGTVLSLFTGLALLTSFFGVAMSLFHQNSDTFKQNRVVTYVLTFVLPLIGAIMAADQFLSVLAYAGIILVFLAVFVPLAMVYKLRIVNTLSERYAAEGGNAMMIFGLAFGGFLLVSQVI